MLPHKHIMLLLDWYDYRIHRGVSKVAKKFGWQLNCPKNLAAHEGILKGWQGDGCIALLDNDQTLEHFSKLKIPLIDLGLRNHLLEIPRIITDNYKIGKLAAEHFRDYGYREVFVIDHGNNAMYRERYDGLKNSVESGGGKITLLKRASNIQNELIDELRQISANRGIKLEEQSIGFFAYHDTMAAEMISLCLRHKLRIPENIAILGVDNDDLINGGLSVELSSVDSDQEGLGTDAARLLSALLDNTKKSPKNKIYRHSPKGVVARRSTDCYAVHNPLVANALHWIHKNFYNGIQATDVADAMGITQQGLQKAFAAAYSRSPGQEIRYQRVQAVAHLLSTTNAKLDNIAKNCGYYSVNSLINSFRKRYGTTPGKYRQSKKLERNELS
ncbi:MAG: hypothetical protein CL815_02765 [Coraliomargarita sp.]|nr:hypothetical protein [Coraliomargarita sp.]